MRVGVDRDDHVRAFHADPVLDRAADAGRDVELRPHGLAGLADLPIGLDPAGLHHRSGAADLGPEHPRQVPDQLEVVGLLQALAAGHDDVRVGQVDGVAVGVGDEVEQLGDDVGLDHPERHLDAIAAAAVVAPRHLHHAWADGGHLRPVGQRHDRAQQRAAEGRPRRRQRAPVDVELGAVGRQAGAQRGGHRARQVAAHRRRAEQHDLRLVLVDEVGQALREGFVAVALQHRVADEVAAVGAVRVGLAGVGIERLVRSAHQHAGDVDLQLVGELARLAHQLPADGVDVAAVVFDEHPDALVGLQRLGQFGVAAGTSRRLRRRGFGSFCHGVLLRR